VKRSSCALAVAGVLLALASIVAACGGGEAERDTSAPAVREKNGTPSPATRAAPATKTFSKYGFSFTYPGELPVAEEGVAENEPNDASGTLRIGVEGEETRLFVVTWLEAAIFSRSLQGSLDDIFQDYEDSEGIETVDRGELVDTVFEGQRMLYQFFGATTSEGKQQHGIAAAFHCESNHVQFSFLSVNTAISGNEAILGDFQTYLDSFVCDAR
jgi:hypothetical protein